MSFDLLIPFAILLVLVIYFIYTRSKFEKNIQDLYEEKFQVWKKNSKIEKEQTNCKKLVALIYEQDYKLHVELIDENIRKRLEIGKFSIGQLRQE